MAHLFAGSRKKFWRGEIRVRDIFTSQQALPVVIWRSQQTPVIGIENFLWEITSTPVCVFSFRKNRTLVLVCYI